MTTRSANVRTRGGSKAAIRRSGQPKPAVAYQSEALAFENLRHKAHCLQCAAVGAPPFPDPAVLLERNLVPTSLRQFHAWTSDKLAAADIEVEPFRTSAPATLKRHERIHSVVEKAISDLLVLRIKRKRGVTRRDVSVARLHRELAVEKTLRGIGEREIISSRRQVIKLEAIASKLRAQLSSLETQSERQIAGLKGELSATQKKVAELTSAVSKIVPLRKA